MIEWLADNKLEVNHLASNLNSDPTSTYDEAVTDVALTQAVITALTRLAVPAAVDPLILMMSHPDLRIRMHVLSALRQLAPDEAQQKIQHYLHGELLSPTAKQYISETLAAW